MRPADILKNAAPFFFTAMNAGYAIDAPALTANLFPGSKIHRYEDKNFLLADWYFMHPVSRKSLGTTMIWVKDGIVETPIWFMHYWGEYEKEAIPFLKKVLTKAYGQRLFCGGRGLALVTSVQDDNSKLVYKNKLVENSNFKAFAGREEITKNDTDSLGHHDYFGQILLDLES